MSDKLTVKEGGDLLPFLIGALNNWSRKKIKQRLQGGCVLVNENPVLRHDHLLVAGDQIEVTGVVKRRQVAKGQLEVLFSDREIIAVNKPEGLLSVASLRENRDHALFILRNQLSRPRHPVKLWPVNRLDRDTSGVLLFATSLSMREAVAALWDKAEKTYLAVVEGCPALEAGTIDQPLRMDHDEYRMHVGAHDQAKRAVTHYKRVRTTQNRSLVELKLETGRQHQLRAHLAWLGHAIVGDARYGNNGSRMGLHALRLTILHPNSGKRLSFEAPPPENFMALLR